MGHVIPLFGSLGPLVWAPLCCGIPCRKKGALSQHSREQGKGTLNMQGNIHLGFEAKAVVEPTDPRCPQDEAVFGRSLE